MVCLKGGRPKPTAPLCTTALLRGYVDVGGGFRVIVHLGSGGRGSGSKSFEIWHV